MSRRFIYDRMTAKDLSEALDNLGMSPFGFARIFGVNYNVVLRWLNDGKDHQDIPPWVYVAVSMLVNLPGALPVAREAAASHIKQDNLYPDRGEYPYATLRDRIEEDDKGYVPKGGFD